VQVLTVELMEWLHADISTLPSVSFSANVVLVILPVMRSIMMVVFQCLRFMATGNRCIAETSSCFHACFLITLDCTVVFRNASTMWRQ